jgi:AcrR family transcriptional regulator
VFEAALALLEEGGYPAATIEAISARSGVAKSSIYRRWPNRTALFVDLMGRLTETELPAPVGRDPLRGLQLELRTAGVNADRVPGRLMVSLLGEAQHDPEVRAALLQRVLLPRREVRARAIRRAQASGILRGDLHPNVAVDLLWGPVFYRMLVRHEPVTPGFVTEVFENVLNGLRPLSRDAKPASRVTRRPSRRAKRA